VALLQHSRFSNCFNCLFENNEAFEYGGAIYIKESVLDSIFNTIFRCNLQTGSNTLNGGGALSIINYSKFLGSSNCSFD
jgi:predicted outer membrane repeat protein